jgi:hypothetical protein
MKGQQELQEEKNLSNKERSKILEVLISQERVLTLLYDKTFPPRSQQGNMPMQLQGLKMPMTSQKGLINTESLH